MSSVLPSSSGDAGDANDNDKDKGKAVTEASSRPPLRRMVFPDLLHEFECLVSLALPEMESFRPPPKRPLHSSGHKFEHFLAGLSRIVEGGKRHGEDLNKIIERYDQEIAKQKGPAADD